MAFTSFRDEHPMNTALCVFVVKDMFILGYIPDEHSTEIRLYGSKETIPFILIDEYMEIKYGGGFVFVTPKIDINKEIQEFKGKLNGRQV